MSTFDLSSFNHTQQSRFATPSENRGSNATVSAAQYRTLAQILADHAQTRPDKTLFTFLHNDDSTQTVTYRELVHDAQATAAYFYDRGIRTADPVILAMDHGYDLICAFWGAIWLGAHPMVFPYVNNHGKTPLYTTRLPQLLKRVARLHVVTTPVHEGALRDLITPGARPNPQWDARLLPFAATQVANTSLPASFSAPAAVDPNEPAYIQFSSGTTGTPKGFYISHAACQTSLLVLNRTLAFTDESVSVGWVPLYHDMGLCSLMLQPLIAGASSVLMAPHHWLRRPRRLFQAVHDYRGTAVWMPNVGYAHSLRHIETEQLAQWDLSCLDLLCWGAEQTDPEKITEIVNYFAPAGLSPHATTSVWGMAEFTLVMTATRRDSALRAERVPIHDLYRGGKITPRHAWDPLNRGADVSVNRGRPALENHHEPFPTRDIITCGRPLEHIELAILTPDGVTTEDHVLGEVLARGHRPSLFSSYFPEQPVDPTVIRPDGWFNTGDLGYLVQGELYICGRQKDTIILGGENIMPDGLESVARQELGPDARRAAAFGIPNRELGTEVAVLVCELKGVHDPAIHADALARMRRAVQSRLGINLADARLVRPGWIEVTTSGKLARHATRAKYLQEFGEPVIVRSDLSFGDNGLLIASLMAEVLQLPDVGLDDDFFELGGDSLAATRFVLTVESVFNQSVPDDFYSRATVRRLLELLGRAQS